MRARTHGEARAGQHSPEYPADAMNRPLRVAEERGFLSVWSRAEGGE